jgi:hypothetical protein
MTIKTETRGSVPTDDTSARAGAAAAPQLCNRRRRMPQALKCVSLKRRATMGLVATLCQVSKVKPGKRGMRSPSLLTSVLAIVIAAMVGPALGQSGGSGGGGARGSAAGSGGATGGGTSGSTGTGVISPRTSPTDTRRGGTTGTATPNPALNTNPSLPGQTAVPTPDVGSGQSASPGSAGSKGDGNTPQTGNPGVRATNRGNMPDPSPNTQTQANSPSDRGCNNRPPGRAGLRVRERAAAT